MNLWGFSCTLDDEEECRQFIMKSMSLNAGATLDKKSHVNFLLRCIDRPLPSGYTSLDASRPWLFFWTLRSLSLLDSLPDTKDPYVTEILALQHADGGFCGNHGQSAHLAATYAACASLMILNVDLSSVINIENMSSFLRRLKVKTSGSFMIQENGGEEDLRAAYCAAAVAHMCKIADNELFDDSFVRRIVACQTYEGGLGAIPFAEAHGGYTYCGVAALSLIGKASALKLDALIQFVQRLQCSSTGGLRGRTHKLVDGCYSFWQSAALIIATIEKDNDLLSLESKFDHNNNSQVGNVLDWPALKRYILGACQDDCGGLRDKPGKPADLYHTCYCLSGLQLCNTASQAKPFLHQSLLLNIL